MSIYMVLGLVFLLYLIPELVRVKKQEYEYPELPDTAPAPAKMPPPLYDGYAGEGVSMEHPRFADRGKGVSVQWQAKSPGPKVVMPEEVAVPHCVANEDPWAGRLSPQDITNGVIFAEILQPPRAKRPLQCWRKR